MKALPYFRWYPADAETDLAYGSMDWQERGLFHHCLNVAWINGGIPTALDDLAAALKTSVRRLEKPWVKVSKQFHVSESNALLMVNDRQEQERAYATTKSERNTNAVRTRYERTTNEPQRASESVCGSSSIKKETNKAVIRFSEFPKTEAAICRRWANADLLLVAKIIQASAQAYLSVDNPKIPIPGDTEFAGAVDLAVRESPGQESPALFLKTVPTVIANWAKYGKSDGGNGTPRLVFK